MTSNIAIHRSISTHPLLTSILPHPSVIITSNQPYDILLSCYNRKKVAVYILDVTGSCDALDEFTRRVKNEHDEFNINENKNTKEDEEEVETIVVIFFRSNFKITYQLESTWMESDTRLSTVIRIQSALYVLKNIPDV